MKAEVTLLSEDGLQAQLLGDTIFQGAPVVVDVEHHEIHCGDAYSTTRTVDLGNGATDTLIIVVPNETGTGQTQKKYHLVISVDSEAECQFEIYEGATTVSNGTLITNYNRERNSANTSNLGIYHTPTTPAGGTLIHENHWGSGRSTGGGARGQEEWVLKNNTKYRLVVTNSTSTANYISWELNHYIHPGI